MRLSCLSFLLFSVSVPSDILMLILVFGEWRLYKISSQVPTNPTYVFSLSDIYVFLFKQLYNIFIKNIYAVDFPLFSG